LYAEFLLVFPRQGGLVGFAFLGLAAGEFPFSAEIPAGLSPNDKKFNPMDSETRNGSF
jgi:hypothetical protein